MRKLIIFLVLALVIIAAAFVFLKPKTQSQIDETGQEQNSQQFQDGSVSFEDENSKGTEENSENAISGTAGGDGSTAPDPNEDDNPSTKDFCTQTIPYLMSKFTTEENCLTEQNQICVEKSVNCTVTVQNLDNDLTGGFTVKFDFKTKNEIVSTLTQSKEIQPRQEQIFSQQKTFTSPESENSFDCSFSMQSAPQKQVC